jgi:hypothetical protein
MYASTTVGVIFCGEFPYVCRVLVPSYVLFFAAAILPWAAAASNSPPARNLANGYTWSDWAFVKLNITRYLMGEGYSSQSGEGKVGHDAARDTGEWVRAFLLLLTT